jgi:hypothetical protein
LVAVSVKLSVALRAPATVGAKRMLAVQLAAAARLVPQVLLNITKSPGLAPVRAMLLMVIAVVPLFVRVTTFCAPLPPTTTDAQLRLVGETVAAARQLIPGKAHKANSTFPACAIDGLGTTMLIKERVELTKIRRAANIAKAGNTSRPDAEQVCTKSPYGRFVDGYIGACSNREQRCTTKTQLRDQELMNSATRELI